MPTCCALGCANKTGGSGKNIDENAKSFFRIPDPNVNPEKAQLAQRWLDVIGRGLTTSSFKFGPSKVLCEDHFAVVSFERNFRRELLGLKTRKRLKADAYPTILHLPKRHSSKLADRTMKNGSTPELKAKKHLPDRMMTTGSSPEVPVMTHSCTSTKSPHHASVTNPTTHIKQNSVGIQTDKWCGNCGHHTRHSCAPENINSVSQIINNDHLYVTPARPLDKFGPLHSTPVIDTQEVTDDSSDMSHLKPDEDSTWDDEDDMVTLDESEISFCFDEMEQNNCYILDEEKYIVFENCIDQLFKKIPCSTCSCPVDDILKSCTGSMLTVKLYCTGGHQVLDWKSQPILSCRAPAGNVLLSAGILFTGQTYKHFSDFANLLRLKFVGRSNFFEIQNDYLLPVIEKHWFLEQQAVIASLQDEIVQVAGDGRCDSPGFSAKYCNYTIMENKTSLVVDFAIIEVTEAKSSAGMEVIGFERVMDRLIGLEPIPCCLPLKISDVSTDRHISVRKLMKEKYCQMNIQHQFDPYHMANSLRKKLLDKGRYKKFSALVPWIRSICNHLWWCAASCQGDSNLLIEKWESLNHHIVNEHVWQDGTGATKACSHQPLSENESRRKKWLRKDSPAHLALKEIVLNKRFTNDLRLLSKFIHTGRLEVFHSLLNKYCPKRQDFDTKQMTARTQLAALDHNHSTRSALSSDCSLQPEKMKVCYSKHCRDWVLKPISQKKNYSYLQDMLADVLHRRNHGIIECVQAQPKAPHIAKVPKPSKDLLVARHRSRLAH